MIRGKYQIMSAVPIGLAMSAGPLSAQGVRPNVNTPAGAQMLASYARAIEVMRRLPANDPHSWSFQANLHGFVAGTPNPSPMWGQCQHGNWWFLSWHRTYLHCFEKIIRVHSGDANFALPYWDWSDATSRSLPTAFRATGSPLYDGTRRASVNNGSDALDESVIVSDVNYALSRTAFFSVSLNDAADTFGGVRVTEPSHFHAGSGALELSPHNYVHGWVGGNMGDPDRAARDPLFFLHHANVDRLWDLWLASGDRANPTSEPIWMNQGFTLFDENKRPVTLAARDMLNTRTQLNYVYADRLLQAVRAAAAKRPPQVKFASGQRPKPRVQLVLEPQKPWGDLKKVPMQIALKIDAAEAGPLYQLARKDKVAKGELVLVVEGISFGAGVADSPLELFLNLPANANQPAIKQRYLADRTAFFGHAHNGTARFRLGEAFERVRTQEGFRPEALTFTLARNWYGATPPATPLPVTFKRVTIQVEQ